jgi:hypothetical protein
MDSFNDENLKTHGRDEFNVYGICSASKIALTSAIGSDGCSQDNLKKKFSISII